MAAHARATTSGIFDAQRSCVFGNIRCRGVASFGGGSVAAAGRRVNYGTGKLLNLRVDVVDNAWDPSSAVAGLRVVMSGFEALSVLVVVFLRKLGPGKTERQVAPRLDVSMRSPLNAAENPTSDNWDKGVNGGLR